MPDPHRHTHTRYWTPVAMLCRPQVRVSLLQSWVESGVLLISLSPSLTLILTIPSPSPSSLLSPFLPRLSVCWNSGTSHVHALPLALSAHIACAWHCLHVAARGRIQLAFFSGVLHDTVRLQMVFVLPQSPHHRSADQARVDRHGFENRVRGCTLNKGYPDLPPGPGMKAGGA